MLHTGYFAGPFGCATSDTTIDKIAEIVLFRSRIRAQVVPGHSAGLQAIRGWPCNVSRRCGAPARGVDAGEIYGERLPLDARPLSATKSTTRTLPEQSVHVSLACANKLLAEDNKTAPEKSSVYDRRPIRLTSKPPQRPGGRHRETDGRS